MDYFEEEERALSHDYFLPLRKKERHVAFAFIAKRARQIVAFLAKIIRMLLSMIFMRRKLLGWRYFLSKMNLTSNGSIIFFAKKVLKSSSITGSVQWTKHAIKLPKHFMANFLQSSHDFWPSFLSSSFLLPSPFLVYSSLFPSGEIDETSAFPAFLPGRHTWAQGSRKRDGNKMFKKLKIYLAFFSYWEKRRQFLESVGKLFLGWVMIKR